MRKNRMFFGIAVVAGAVMAAGCLLACGEPADGQAREREQRLVYLLNDYNEAYAAYAAQDAPETAYAVSFVLPNGDELLPSSEIIRAEAAADSAYGGYVVALKLTEDGKTAFFDGTSANIGAVIEIRLTEEDGTPVVIASPTVNSAVTEPIISGFDEDGAKELAAQINAGIGYDPLFDAAADAAKAYNLERADMSADESILPAALPESKPLLDVSAYLAEASRRGFSLSPQKA